MDPRIKHEMDTVIARQESDLKGRIQAFGKGSLIRILKVVNGGLGKGIKLSEIEQKFIDDLFNYQDNYLANLQLTDEFIQASKGEDDGEKVY